MSNKLALYFGYRISFVCILLFYTFSVHSQAMTLLGVRFLSAAPSFEEPADELNLLPDTPSYYVIEELYNGDSLTRKGNKLTFYNYGDVRYAIYGDLNTSTYMDKIIKLEKINDTFSLQTTTRFERRGHEFDSTLIWWKNGLIDRALVIRDAGLRIEYTYLYDNNRLIQRTKHNPRFGKTEIIYSYDESLLTKILYRDAQEEDDINFHYNDTLVTTHCISKTHRINSITRLDKSGRKLSLRVFMGKKDDPEKLYQSEDYTYFHDGGFQMIATQHSSELVSKLEFHPGYFATERWTWEGSEQVLVLRYFPL